MFEFVKFYAQMFSSLIFKLKKCFRYPHAFFFFWLLLFKEGGWKAFICKHVSCEVYKPLQLLFPLLLYTRFIYPVLLCIFQICGFHFIGSRKRVLSNNLNILIGLQTHGNCSI